MSEDAARELERVCKELQEKIREGQLIEALFYQWHGVQSGEVALARDLARERFNTLLGEITILRRREHELKQKLQSGST